MEKKNVQITFSTLDLRIPVKKISVCEYQLRLIFPFLIIAIPFQEHQ